MTQDGYVAQDGKHMTGKPGKTFAALKACIRSWILLIMKPNAAERHKMYMQTQIYMCQHGVHVKWFVSRIVKMNDYMEFMLCLKDVEGLPAELTHADQLFSSMEMCYIVLNAILYGLACAYWAKH